MHQQTKEQTGIIRQTSLVSSGSEAAYFLSENSKSLPACSVIEAGRVQLDLFVAADTVHLFPIFDNKSEALFLNDTSVRLDWKRTIYHSTVIQV